MEHKRGHVLAVPYPSQGHITPFRQFCKRLHFKGLKTTLALTTFVFNSINPDLSGPISIATISDGYDHGGFETADSIDDYLKDFKTSGSKTIADIIQKHQTSDNPITCIVYDAFLPWALDVAREFGLVATPFFTQPCAVNYVYYLSYINNGSLQLPIEELPFLELQDLPSFFSVSGSYPAYFEMVLQQFINFEKADFVLVNSFQELELHENELWSKACPVLTIGPTIPSIYLDQRIKSDTGYDLNLFESKDDSFCINWLDTRPQGSVVYVAFGSMAQLTNVQMEELASAVSNFSFLWVVRSSEEEKLPSGFLETVNKEKSLVLKWSPQLQVLSNKAIGCFLTHCGWNSTMEALTFGVPMVAMPQWTDQPMNAKYIQDVWKAGVRVKTEKESGIAKREEIEFSIKEVMEGERSKEMKKNVKKWRDLAVKSLNEGGSTDTNIDTFVSRVQSK
uniref:UDP-glycosyltransferase 74F2 n=1 Tax=Arabidopsis thaliana TaxID=3702 RepID=UPI000A1C7A42|nr:Chain A, UDP-glycosyltransferase 74F2 [Arabidopsis thaliana]5U6N_B Chain B, UDP-glycosyltransferase 74F2 [Arabidopsis thaliana]5V2J_A Chain A, UDP-glycosyltransferase 74F2 [Arabidopsis thaliana]5V2J_B Chain B, UDP-glycosyltransferase 74F2 [Arabidopsis thaliana]